MRKSLKKTEREEVPECIFQANIPVETIHYKEQPDEDGDGIYKNLKQELMVNLEVTGGIIREVTQSNDSGQV